MALSSSIEWTESTWNPVTGCTKISLGCKNCYAERLSRRLQAMGNPSYTNGFELTCHNHLLEQPLKWKKPQRIFVNSMSDLFHEGIPKEFVLQVFNIMKQANWHQYQILTKRSEQLLKLNRELEWMPHIWMGVTVEASAYKYRIDDLRETGAKVKFLSLEPLLEPISNIDLSDIDWVIVGGESGRNARPMESSWVLDIQNQCEQAKVPFFFKQWGGINKKRNGRILNGKTWNEMPCQNVLQPSFA